jgi:hypothetical protein
MGVSTIDFAASEVAPRTMTLTKSHEMIEQRLALNLNTQSTQLTDRLLSLCSGRAFNLLK